MADRPAAIALPAVGSPLGTIEVNKDRCTLCLSCVSACPASALQDNPQLPQLQLHRKELRAVRPVRYHLPGRRHHPAAAPAAHARACATAGAQRSQALGLRALQQALWHGEAIEAMLGKLAGHAMFQGEALERLKMCSDCRVIDLYSSQSENESDGPVSAQPASLTPGGSSALDEETARRTVWPAVAAVLRRAQRRVVVCLAGSRDQAPADGAFLQEPWQVLVGAARELSDAAIAQGVRPPLWRSGQAGGVFVWLALPERFSE